MASEAPQGVNLVTSRVPVGPTDTSDESKSAGNRAVLDAVLIIAVAWGILFVLVYSLRAHNV